MLNAYPAQVSPPRPRAMERKTVEAPRFMIRAVSSMNTACQAGTEFRIRSGAEFRKQRIGYEHSQPGRHRVQNIGTVSEFRKADKKLRTR